MPDKSTLALTMAEADLERIITTTIQAQVAAAFAAKGGDVAGKVIERLLTEKVDSSGTKSRYQSENDQTLVEYLCRGQLRAMVKEAIVTWIQQNEAELRKAVVAQLNKKKTKDSLANALLASLVSATANQYRFDIKVAASLEEPEY